MERPQVNPLHDLSISRSPDLPSVSVTVAQALHWFDFERFYVETKRVLKPRGVFVAWTYALNEVSVDVDAVIRRFYRDVVGSYWPPERRHIEAGYRTIPLPFTELTAPPIHMETQWTLADYIGYLRTWSATQRYLQALRSDPIALIAAALEQAWGAQTTRIVHWPLHVRAGRMA